MSWLHRWSLIVALVGMAVVPVVQAHDATEVHEPASLHAEPVPQAASPLWTVTMVANVVMAVTFAAIAWFLWRALIRGQQWRSNPLLVGITLIFTTCAVGHALHAEHTLLPTYAPLLQLPGWEEAVTFGAWSQVAMANPALAGMDVASAGAAVWYFATRQRHAEAFQGAELAEDLEILEEEARYMQDTVVQTTTEALLHMDMDDDEAALEDITQALDDAKGIVDRFLAEGRAGEVRPGDLILIERPDS